MQEGGEPGKSRFVLRKCWLQEATGTEGDSKLNSGVSRQKLALWIGIASFCDNEKNVIF